MRINKKPNDGVTILEAGQDFAFVAAPSLGAVQSVFPETLGRDSLYNVFPALPPEGETRREGQRYFSIAPKKLTMH